MKSLTKALILGSTLALATISNTGCAYRPDLYQGNFTEQKDVDLLRIGMSQSQVKYILGTPMLVDPLDKTKWYYINYVRKGWSDPEQKTLVVVFSNNVVSDIYGDYQKPATFFSPLNFAE